MRILFLVLILAVWCHADTVDTLQRQVGVRETTGRNDGPMVEEYLRAAGLEKGDPWCAAFITWGQKINGKPYPIENPGYVPAWNLAAKRRMEPERGLFGLVWFQSMTRYAHIYCVVERMGRSTVKTVEGNTNNGNSRDGDGVYNRIRPVQGSRFVDWRQ